ncbi:MAG: hypothetical protein AAF629_22390, partial [Chloroflexota bacterium]
PQEVQLDAVHSILTRFPGLVHKTYTVRAGFRFYTNKEACKNRSALFFVSMFSDNLDKVKEVYDADPTAQIDLSLLIEGGTKYIGRNEMR